MHASTDSSMERKVLRPYSMPPVIASTEFGVLRRQRKETADIIRQYYSGGALFLVLGAHCKTDLGSCGCKRCL